jgi:hypothetical protein
MIAAPGSTPAGQTAEHFERGVAAPGPVGVVDQAEHGPRVRVARFLRDDLAGAAEHLDTDSPSIRAIADAPPSAAVLGAAVTHRQGRKSRGLRPFGRPA